MSAPEPLPDEIADIRIYVEGADGLHGRPFLPDHAIEVLQDIAHERQRQTDVCGHDREKDDGLAVGDFVDLIVDRAEAAANSAFAGVLCLARIELLQVAAMAMAAVEAVDRRTGNARKDDPADILPAGPGSREEAAHG